MAISEGLCPTTEPQRSNRTTVIINLHSLLRIWNLVLKVYALVRRHFNTHVNLYEVVRFVDFELYRKHLGFISYWRNSYGLEVY